MIESTIGLVAGTIIGIVAATLFFKAKLKNQIQAGQQPLLQKLQQVESENRNLSNAVQSHQEKLESQKSQTVEMVSNGTLGVWNLEGVSSGPYTLRLRAFDASTNAREHRVDVTVLAPNQPPATFLTGPNGMVLDTDTATFFVSATRRRRSSSSSGVRKRCRCRIRRRSASR